MQDVEAHHVADGDASSEEEEEERQAAQPGEDGELPPVVTDPAFEQSGGTSGSSLMNFVLQPALLIQATCLECACKSVSCREHVIGRRQWHASAVLAPPPRTVRT